MLLGFLHDNISFSDRLVELTAVDSPTEPVLAKDHANVPSRTEVDTAEGRRDDKPLGH